MDEWLTLDEAAFELDKASKYLIKIASRGEITLTWQPGDFIRLFHVDNESGVPKHMHEDNWDCFDGPLVTSREGYFNIDLSYCPEWNTVLYEIYLGGTGYAQVFGPDGPLAIKEICPPDEYLFSVTPPPWFQYSGDLCYPTFDTLGVFESELKRYKQQLVNGITVSNQSKIQKQGNAIIQEIIALGMDVKDIRQSEKNIIRDKLKNNLLFNANSAFKNAWQWLIENKKIITHLKK